MWETGSVANKHRCEIENPLANKNSDVNILEPVDQDDWKKIKTSSLQSTRMILTEVCNFVKICLNRQKIINNLFMRNDIFGHRLTNVSRIIGKYSISTDNRE